MLETTRGLLDTKMPVGEKSFIIEKRNTPTSIEIGLNTSTCRFSTCRSQSWLRSLMRMLMVLCSEVCCVMNQDSKCLSQETTLVLEGHKRTR